MRYFGICRYYVDDEEVVADNELQELVNELSADGKHGDFGGLGMVRRSSESIIIYHKRSLYIQGTKWDSILSNRIK